MILNEDIKKNLENLHNANYLVLQSSSLTKEQIQNFLLIFERTRYNVLNEFRKYNKKVEFEYEKITTIDDEYKAELKLNGKALKIYVPEILLSYKNLKSHTYKRILSNIAGITETYANLFKDEVFLLIIIYDKKTGWDVDNKDVKPIADGLVESKVIKDDNMSKMFYCVEGKFSEIPHTEIYVTKGEYAELVMQKYGH